MSNRLRADLTLFLVAIIWGSAFVVQRVAAATIGPILFNGCRFLLGGLILLVLVRFRLKIERENRLWVVATGLVLASASFLQQAGLQWTTAGNAGFITGLYVVFIPLMLLAIWRHRLGWITWMAVGIAALGIFLLSANGKFELAPGDGLELAGAVLWAVHVILVGKAMEKMEVFPFAIGQYLVAGVVSLVAGIGLESNTLPGILSTWWSIAYVGILSVAVGYTLQALAQKHAPPVDASLIMSLEAVFAALFGFLVLGEVLGPLQKLGAGLIMTAIVISQFGSPARKPAETPTLAPGENTDLTNSI